MSAIPADMQVPTSEWRRALSVLALLLVAVVLLYRDTAIAMVGIWARSDTFAHAFLVPPISLWLIWRRRQRVLALPPRPQPWVLAPMAVVAFGWMLGDLVSVNAATQLALVSLIVLCVPLVLGMAITREILFPLAFLFFCVPLGEFLMPTLMEGTADFTIAALRFSGIPVYREGLQFVIPSGHWSVVEACSGVRYLIASFMVGSLFGYLNFSSNLKRLVFAGVSLVVPIIANWLRAYMIVMIGHLSGNKLAVGVDHLIYGWVFFGIVITAMFFIGSRWADPIEAQSSSTSRPVGTAGSARPALAVATAALLLLLLPLGAQQALQRQGAHAGKPVLALPQTLSGGTSAVAAQPLGLDWAPRFLGAAAEAQAQYAVDGRVVGVHVSYYRAQGYDSKLISSQNVVVTSQDRWWNRVGTRRQQVDVGGRSLALIDSELLAAAALAQTTQRHLSVWQVYWVNGQFTASETWAKVDGAIGLLAGRGDDAAALFFFTEGDPQAVAAPVLAAFVQSHLGELEAMLQRTRAAR